MTSSPGRRSSASRASPGEEPRGNQPQRPSSAAICEAAGGLEVNAELQQKTEELARANSDLRRLATVVQDSNDAVTVQDLEGRILAWNRGAERMYGYSKDEALQMNVEALVPEEGRAQARGFLETIARGEEVASLEVSRLTKDGRTLEVWLTTTKLVDDQGRAVAVATTERDVTERKRAEEALRESEEGYRALVTASSEVVYRMNPDWSEMRELRGREFIVDTGMPTRYWLENYIHPDDLPHVTAAIAEAIRTRSTFQAEHRVQRLDGSPGWTFSLAIPLFDGNGAIKEWFGAASNVTARKKAEEALRASEERLRLAQEVAHVGTFEWDIRTGVNTWTPELEAMHGLPRGGFAKTQPAWEKLVHPDDRAEAVRRVEQSFETGAPTEGEWRVVWPDGTVHWLAGRWQVLKDASGKPLRVTGIHIDVTERKRAEALRASEAALREADRQKNEFLAMLSHELRNPLAPIRNSLYILERAAPGGVQARRARAVIDRQLGHMTWLIDDLLDVTRITRGKIRLERECLDLNDLAQRTVEEHRTLFAKSDVRLEVLPSSAEVWVEGDRVRLAQVVGNLLQNAAKFTPRGGRATLSVQADRSRGLAIVTVRDTGAGIRPEMLPRLFRPFTQADVTLDRSKGGLGLGLALVKGLVEMHGGSVTASSGGAGKGAAFTIRLPLDTATARTMPAQHGLGGGAAARRVLVIEDNEDAADTLREVLELDEHVVDVAYTGREGIEKARAFHPDVVLCDIGLPEMDGYEVARAMRADPELGRVALVAVSGYAQPEDVATAREAGFDAHLAKPPSIETLERALTEVGDARRENEPGPS
jgi:PAS domain S-box-containing protein